MSNIIPNFNISAEDSEEEDEPNTYEYIKEEKFDNTSVESINGNSNVLDTKSPVKPSLILFKDNEDEEEDEDVDEPLNNDIPKASIVLFKDNDEEEEDEEIDEPINMDIPFDNQEYMQEEEVKNIASQEFIESLQVITSNPNCDASVWNNYLYEIKCNNYGSISLLEAYKRELPTFHTYKYSYLSLYTTLFVFCLPGIPV